MRVLTVWLPRPSPTIESLLISSVVAPYKITRPSIESPLTGATGT